MNENNEVQSDQLPDRLSVDPRSPHYNAEILARDVGIPEPQIGLRQRGMQRLR